MLSSCDGGRDDFKAFRWVECGRRTRSTRLVGGTTYLGSIDRLISFQLEFCPTKAVADGIDGDGSLDDGEESRDSICNVILASQHVQRPADVDSHKREQNTSCKTQPADECDDLPMIGGCNGGAELESRYWWCRERGI